MTNPIQRVLPALVLACLLWPSEASARKHSRDYLELHLGVLGHAGVTEPVGVLVGPGGSIGLGVNFTSQLGMSFGFLAIADWRVPEFPQKADVLNFQVYGDLEFMQSRRPARTDIYYILGGSATVMGIAGVEDPVQAYGVRFGAGADIAITEMSRGSYFKRSAWVLGFRGIGNASLLVPVTLDRVPVRFDVIAEAQLKVHFQIF